MSSNLYTLDANDCSFGQINENIACIQDEKTRLEAMFDEEMARLKARMEEEIGRLDGQINSLEKLRNNYVPIFRLPPEILREIISIYKLDVEERHDQQMHGSSSYPCQSIYPTYRWIKVTHVCRRLRAVAINYPALWTAIHIPLTPPEWADEVLIRSQPLPLSVLSLGMAVPYPYKGKLPDSSDLLHYLGKDGTARPLHRLHVCLNRPPKIHQSEILWSIFNDLEELVLWETEDAPRACDPLIQLFATNPSPFRLTSLSLNCHTWDSRLLHDTLSSLSLHGCSTYSKMDWESFLLCLTSIRQLQNLHLYKVLCQLRPHTIQQTTSIRLTHLKSLKLSGDNINQHLDFIKAVSFPLTARIAVWNDTEDMETFCTFLMSLTLTCSPRHSFQYLRLGAEQWGCNLKHVNIELDPFSNPRRARYSIWCNFKSARRSFPEELNEGILHFIQSLPIGDLQDLELCSGSRFRFSQPLLQIFSTLPTLNTITIEEDTAKTPITNSLVSLLPQCKCSKVDPWGPRIFPESACNSCEAILKTCFGNVKRLGYVRMEYQGLREEPLPLLQQVVLGFLLGKHKLKELVLKGWNWDTNSTIRPRYQFKEQHPLYHFVEREFGALCDEITWRGRDGTILQSRGRRGHRYLERT